MRLQYNTISINKTKSRLAGYVTVLILLLLFSSRGFAQNAGTDQDLCDVQSTTLAADDPSPDTGTWTVVTAPGTVNFDDNTLYNTGISVNAYGAYTLRWTLSGGESDDVTINFYEQPVANAGTGGDECDLNFILNATASVGNGTWTVSGPGTASYSPDANTPGATATVSAYGSYQFTWTEVNGSCSDAASVTVNFYEQPVANAGTGGDECDLNFILNATASVGNGTWTVSGPGTASYSPDA
ncbi:MAG: hypothetical protein V2I37_12540, partial [Marinilabiliaceae bacterium]|nr:hypothetical protein [Marinilabiliaceae bacterium]